MKIISVLFLIILGFSCLKNDELETVSDDSVPIDVTTHSNDYNGYRKSKTVNGFNIDVTYIPNAPNTGPLDTENEADQSVHFLMEIESDGAKHEGNFLYKDVNGAEDFKNNVNYFNFSIIDDVSVAVNGTQYKVVLSNMESTYTLGDNRKIHFVAVPPSQEFEKINIEEISFVYDDVVLGIGITKFSFNAKDFKPVPNKI